MRNHCEGMWLNAKLCLEGSNRLQFKILLLQLWRSLEPFAVACILLMLLLCASSFREVVLELILCLIDLPA